jgi:two-component system sensor histidine kinase MprB
LGRSLQQMLASLLRSREQQQRLIQDAGHELRTPLTSLRTNIAVLGSFERLSPDQRLALTADLRSETDEMAELVEELVELSIGGDEPVEHGVDLTRIVERAATRVQRRRGRDVLVTAEQIEIDGQPRALDRAIGNLLDNAMKFDSGSDPIELTLAAGRVEVADRGPGIPEDQLDLIFNRFHRAVEARNVPGSGLGLSIVSQVATEHGGSAYARNRSGGGAVVGFTFSSS